MIANLNQRATIEQPVRTSDGAGGASESWSTLAVVWAKLEPVTSTDRFAAAALEAKSRYKLTLRRLASAAAGMRAVIGSRTFAINGVLDAGPGAPLMTLLCEESP
jgi:SPP1 family predicted phage head-tail adaptor